jgi:N-acetylglucosamine-6-phosphate deacetylase
MICYGRDIQTESPLQVVFGETIERVAPVERPVSVYVAPGWIDLQVNGVAGVDYNAPDTPLAEIARSIQFLFTTGVTRFYPTVITNSPENMIGCLRNLAHAREVLAEGGAMEAFHVEGPHISPEEGPRGAHSRQWVRPPDLEEFRRWQDAARGHIRLVTLAPEWPQTPQYIETIVREGVVASIGHTGASASQIADAVSAGATLCTHLGNGAHPVLPKLRNYLWDQLAEDRLMADFIVDGIHLGAAFVKAAIRAKGIGRSILITDVVAPAGCAPGRYWSAGQEVELTAGQRVVIAGQQRLAGSALRMDRGVENLMKTAGLSLGDAVRMATTNAARAAHVPLRVAGLAAGDRADLIIFHFDRNAQQIEIDATYLDGRCVYNRPGVVVEATYPN